MFAVARWPELSGGNWRVMLSLSQLESSEEESSRLKMIKEHWCMDPPAPFESLTTGIMPNLAQSAPRIFPLHRILNEQINHLNNMT